MPIKVNADAPKPPCSGKKPLTAGRDELVSPIGKQYAVQSFSPAMRIRVIRPVGACDQGRYGVPLSPFYEGLQEAGVHISYGRPVIGNKLFLGKIVPVVGNDLFVFFNHSS